MVEGELARLAASGRLATRFEQPANGAKSQLRDSSRSRRTKSLVPNSTKTSPTCKPPKCQVLVRAKLTCENYHKLVSHDYIGDATSRRRGGWPLARLTKTEARRRRARAAGLWRDTHPGSSSSRSLKLAGSKMLRLIRWPLAHLCLPLCLTMSLLVVLSLAAMCTYPAECYAGHHHHRAAAVASVALPAQSTMRQEEHPSRNSQSISKQTNITTSAPSPPPPQRLPGSPLASSRQEAGQAPVVSGPSLAQREEARNGKDDKAGDVYDDDDERRIKTQDFHRIREAAAGSRRRRSLPWATTSVHQQQQKQHQASSLLMPINELRVSGSKLEPPSRPSQDWSKQRPYFGTNLQRNISVELGKTAHLVCKVFELGDKTVSWLRPRENEILTAGKYTYVSDPRISAMNENGSTDWVLEIKDVGLNDSTSYECQVSTDPKLSQIFNLHVQAARARIKSGENNYYPVGANIEFACEILPPPGSLQHQFTSSRAYNLIHQANDGAGDATSLVANDQQIYWYHNGNLMNYAKTLVDFGGSGQLARQNFTIHWDSANQLSRLRLANIQLGDSGNYTCKPTSAEPATVRLFIKKHRNGSSNRVHYNGGAYHAPNAKEAQRTRQHHELGADFMDASGSRGISLTATVGHLATLTSVCLMMASLNCLFPQMTVL